MNRRAAGGGMDPDPEPTLMLVMQKGPLKGEAREFQPGTNIRIGRIARGNTLAIKDDGISTKHLSINFQAHPGRDGKGVWTISDLGSSNGTILNSDSLEPFVPVQLSDGDVIKLGEWTSIKVRVTVVVEKETKMRKGRTRRGGKLGPAVVDNDNEAALGKTENSEMVDGDNLGEIASLANEIEEKSDKMEISVKKVSEKRTRSKKKEDVLVEKSEPNENAQETEILVEKLRPRRGRPPRQRDALGEVANGNQNGVVERNVVLEGKEESSKRVTRSMRREVNLVDDVSTRRTTRSRSKVGDVEELVQDVDAGNKMTRKSARAKKNVIQNVEDDKVKEDGETVAETLELEAENIEGAMKDSVVNEILEKENDGVVDRILVGEEVLNSELDGSVTMASGSGVEANILKELDLEKITLGEWFDYLEVYLPKQIIDATEEMILGMKQKAKRFHELMLKHETAKDKIGV